MATSYETHFGPMSVDLNNSTGNCTLGKDYFSTISIPQKTFLITSCEFRYDEEITGVLINAETAGKINITVSEEFFFSQVLKINL